jgi:integrase
MATVTKRHWKTAGGLERAAWIVSYSAAGKRHIRTFPSKREADAWKVETLHEIARGIHTPPTASITVAEAGERWIEQCRTDGLEATTVRQYHQHLDLHIMPIIGPMKLAHLSPASVIDFRNALIRKGRSRALASKVLVSLGAILGTAMAAGLVARNVVRDQASGHAKRQRRLEKRHDKRLEVGVDIPTKDEIRALLAACQGRWRLLIVTVIFTGLRASELRGLRWSDVELGAGAGSLHVRPYPSRGRQPRRTRLLGQKRASELFHRAHVVDAERIQRRGREPLRHFLQRIDQPLSRTLALVGFPHHARGPAGELRLEKRQPLARPLDRHRDPTT